ncbi:ets DNA-binding protein pokkuri-like isoform X1 [Schistocerca gregaria]|uniref:ets DNA-binding protein pokkuri-like isoform X1 n=2 Tax=Schistocerca TaxID=7008 RepID=UPI00211DE9DF|nr:ets DNA-binding protein pokkuri-like isoform X1 [Schistocerca gregaria]
MKVLPLSLPPAAVERAASVGPGLGSPHGGALPLSLQLSAGELLWRYPGLGLAAAASASAGSPQHAAAAAAAAASVGGQAAAAAAAAASLHFPSSNVVDFKAHLPPSLASPFSFVPASDPRIWSREDVAAFLKWCEREFDLPEFNMDMFQMNGKALCLLTKADLGERSSAAGDVLHNVLQLLVRDAAALARCLPSSPVTPTSRCYPPPPPPSPAAWGFVDFPPPSGFVHLVQHGNSVTLSPAPSVDSQSGSPQHADHMAASSYHSGSAGSNSNGSDSDDDSCQEAAGPGHAGSSPPPTATAAPAPAPAHQQLQHTQPPPPSLPPPSPTAREPPPSPASNTVFRNAFAPREFFPSDTPEPNTNGRLLWDFLQQLLNDPTQRYTNYIAWKNRDTGVFKIVDPAGLAKLWGIQKNHLSMNYDKMSRALRYYYRVNILRKVQGERHCYQFLRNPSELKSIKNMSLLRQQMSPPRATGPAASHSASSLTIPVRVKLEPKSEPDGENRNDSDTPDESEEPTDLSMEHPTDLSPTRTHAHPNDIN